jgi:hypothetical protein
VFQRTDLNAWLAEFLATHVDPVLGDDGFRRRAGARSYRRRTEYGAQKVEFFAYSRPAYAPREAHLVVNAVFFMPEVMRLGREIFGASFNSGAGDPSLAGGVALDSLPDRPVGLWLFTNRDELQNHAHKVQRALAASVLPFLNASTTLATVATGPARQHLRIEVVAAAYVRLGEPDNALDYLRHRAASHSDLESALLSPASLRALQDDRTRAVQNLEAYRAAAHDHLAEPGRRDDK